MSELVFHLEPTEHAVMRCMVETALVDFERFVRESVDMGFSCADFVLANQLLGKPTFVFVEDFPDKFRQVTLDFMPITDEITDPEPTTPTDEEEILFAQLTEPEHLDFRFDETLEDQIISYTTLLGTTPEAFLIESFNLRWELHRVMQASRKMYVNDETNGDYVEIGYIDAPPYTP